MSSRPLRTGRLKPDDAEFFGLEPWCLVEVMEVRDSQLIVRMPDGRTERIPKWAVVAPDAPGAPTVKKERDPLKQSARRGWQAVAQRLRGDQGYPEPKSGSEPADEAPADPPPPSDEQIIESPSSEAPMEQIPFPSSEPPGTQSDPWAVLERWVPSPSSEPSGALPEPDAEAASPPEPDAEAASPPEPDAEAASPPEPDDTPGFLDIAPSGATTESAPAEIAEQVEATTSASVAEADAAPPAPADAPSAAPPGRRRRSAASTTATPRKPRAKASAAKKPSTPTKATAAKKDSAAPKGSTAKGAGARTAKASPAKAATSTKAGPARTARTTAPKASKAAAKATAPAATAAKTKATRPRAAAAKPSRTSLSKRQRIEIDEDAFVDVIGLVLGEGVVFADACQRIAGERNLRYSSFQTRMTAIAKRERMGASLGVEGK